MSVFVTAALIQESDMNGIYIQGNSIWENPKISR